MDHKLLVVGMPGRHALVLEVLQACNLLLQEDWLLPGCACSQLLHDLVPVGRMGKPLELLWIEWDGDTH